MKLLNVSLARSIWLFPTEELNPFGIDMVPVLAAVKERYSFQKFPQKTEEIYNPKDGIRFGDGAFKVDGGAIAIRELSVYGDGIVVETYSSTKASDAFIADLLSFATGQFRLKFDDGMLRNKIYVSNVVVSTDIDLDSINEKLARFAALLSKELGVSFRVGSLRLLTEPKNGRTAQFIFERRAGTNFDDNRYFAEAPLPTDTHLEMLDEFEKIWSE